MRDIIVNDFANAQYQIDIYNDNWPVVYILKNSKYIYVGETIQYLKRMVRHRREKKKMKFDDSYMITDLDFNMSVAKHYEALIISLIQADGRFTVTNKNRGIKNSNYYNRFIYEEKFKELYKKLCHVGIISQTLQKLYNSTNFKLSPYQELNDDQNRGLYVILQILSKQVLRPIVVTGGPGTGKTTLASYLLLYLKQDRRFEKKKIGFVVPSYNLRETLKELFGNIANLSPSIILSPKDIKGKKYDILICDEAHRLGVEKSSAFNCESSELELIIKQSEYQVFLYDENQVIADNIFARGIFIKKMKMLNYKKVSLETQMRVLGGSDYLKYIRALLYGTVDGKKIFYIDKKQKFDFKIFNSFTHMKDEIERLDNKYSLCKLCAGHAGSEKIDNNKETQDIEIQGEKMRLAMNTKEWLYKNNDINEVGTIHNVQGYDLNYAGVIVGEELRYNNNNNSIYVDFSKYPEKSENRKIKEIEKYILNMYYVLMTRGILGTYVYVCDDALRNYMSKYIELA